MSKNRKGRTLDGSSHRRAALVQAPPHLPPHSHRADNTPTSTLTVFESPISESFKSTAHNSDVEDIETDTTHQVSLPESSPEQSYDLERDSSPHRKVYHRNTQHINPPCRLEVPLPMALREHPIWRFNSEIHPVWRPRQGANDIAKYPNACTRKSHSRSKFFRLRCS